MNVVPNQTTETSSGSSIEYDISYRKSDDVLATIIADIKLIDSFGNCPEFSEAECNRCSSNKSSGKKSYKVLLTIQKIKNISSICISHYSSVYAGETFNLKSEHVCENTIFDPHHTKLFDHSTGFWFYPKIKNSFDDEFLIKDTECNVLDITAKNDEENIILKLDELQTLLEKYISKIENVQTGAISDEILSKVFLMYDFMQANINHH